jgi:hypothetical protein
MEKGNSYDQEKAIQGKQGSQDRGTDGEIKDPWGRGQNGDRSHDNGDL